MRDEIKDWEYLEITVNKINQGKDISVYLRIDGDCSKASIPLEVIHSKDGGSYAFRNLLAWFISGSIAEIISNTTMACNRISVYHMHIER